jgi:Rad3-related DNA helicase
VCSSDLVDLKHDISRFQIVPKVPYLSLGSKAIQYKREQDPRWYDWRTAIRLIQSFGRSVRADDDYARTYIVDGSFQDLWNRVGGMIPEYIEEATTKESVQELLERSRSNAY